MQRQISEVASKLIVIFNQTKLQELPYDVEIKNVLRSIFKNNEEINYEIIPENEILIYFINLVFTLFKLKKKIEKNYMIWKLIKFIMKKLKKMLKNWIIVKV